MATWGSLKTALFERLGDNSFYTDDASVYAEITSYLSEALRLWALAALHWKQRVTFPTAANTAWYSLQSITTSPAGILTPTVQDRFLLAEIEYHFLEPVSFTTWGSTQFTYAQVVGALQRRLDQFMVETGIIIHRDTPATGLIPGTGRFAIPAISGSPIIDVRRIVWEDVDAVRTVLTRMDEFGATSFLPGWSADSPEAPESYSVSAAPRLTVQFIPPPAGNGTLDILGVYAGPTLDPANGVSLGLPDNVAWIVKYGAMADLLNADGISRDALRSSYCERRWREGCELVRLYPSIVQAQINGVNLTVDSIYNLDSFTPGWDDPADAARPDNLAFAGWNLIGLGPVPDGAYGAALDILRPAPIPAADGDSVDLGPEEIDAILGYAQHLGTFKQGGQEFQDTIPLYEQFLRLAAIRNERLKASAIFMESLYDRTTREEKDRKRREVLVQ